MDVLYPDCAGRDVRKKTVVVTVQHRPPGGSRPTKETSRASSSLSLRICWRCTSG